MSLRLCSVGSAILATSHIGTKPVRAGRITVVDPYLLTSRQIQLTSPSGTASSLPAMTRTMMSWRGSVFLYGGLDENGQALSDFTFIDTGGTLR